MRTMPWLALGLALLLVPSPAAAKLDHAAERALAYLDAQAATVGPLAPNVAEAAHALGQDPAHWPADAPIAERIVVPGDDAGAISLLRPLRALALAADPRAAPDGALTQRVAANVGPTGYGDARTLNDDAYAILALRAADPAGDLARLAPMRSALLLHQGDDGGWGWAVGGPSGTDLTGLALEALHASGGFGDADLAAALAFLAATRDPRGGFAESPGGARNCESTVWGIRSQQRLGADVDADDWDFLLGLQRADGGFAHADGGRSDLLCTTEAATLLGENRGRDVPDAGIPAPPAAWAAAGLLALVATLRRTRLRQA